MADEDEVDLDACWTEGEEKDIDESHFLIHAPQGVGKTFLGLSVSKMWPKEKLKKKAKGSKPIVIKDVVHLGADKGALAGVGQYGIQVKYKMSLLTLMRASKRGEKKRPAAEDIMQAMDWATEAITAVVYKHDIIALVVDTLTNLSGAILKHADSLDFRTKSGEENTFAKWQYLADALYTLWEWAASLPCQVYWLCHSQAMKEGESRKEQLNSKAMKGIGQWDIVPTIDGRKAFGLFTSHSSMIATMEADYDEDSKTYDRYVLPVGGAGFLGKNRWLDSLAEKEPANMNQIIKKIKRG